MKWKSKLKFAAIFVFAATIAFASSANAATKFAKADAAASGNGDSWETAYDSAALVSFLNGTPGTIEIHVASGDYELSATNTETFNLKKGVKLYGGYDPLSTGANLASRDISAYKTILNGGGTGRTVAVVTGGANATISDTHIDGFTVTGGNNSGNGGGMANSNSSPTITNCTFSGNMAYGGGGMYNSSSSSPVIKDCIFSGNTMNGAGQYNGGGGMYNSYSSPTIMNCTFSGNAALDGSNFTGGGGMYNSYSSPTITNCTFSENTTWTESCYGGGMYNYCSSPVITNCTFSRNTTNVGLAGGGGMFNDGTSAASIVITNTIFWDNKTATVGRGYAIFHFRSPALILTNCVIDNAEVRTEGASGPVNYFNAVSTNPQIVSIDINGAPATKTADVYIYKIDNASSAYGKGLSVGAHTINGRSVTVPAFDQRGVTRPNPTKAPARSADIGSFEWYVPIISVTIVSQDVEIEVGKTAQLSFDITPTDSAVSWHSEDPSIASVNHGGEITGESEGDTIIWAEGFGNSGIVSDSCKVTVGPATVYVTSVTLDATTKSIKVGENFELTATVVPAGQAVDWVSSNPSVATLVVDEDDGSIVTVSGMGSGNATITVTTLGKDINGKHLVASCDVTVTPRYVTGVSFEITSKNINVGESFDLKFDVQPSDATDKGVTWSSTNDNIASVDISGGGDTVKVKTTAAGKATITVTTTDGSKTASCDVTVIQPVTNVSLNKSTLSLIVNGTETLTATIAPDDATDKSVTWKSSNTEVATVDDGGKVTAKVAGSATITVTTTDGGKTAICAVTVTSGTVAVTGVTVSPAKLSLMRAQSSKLTATVTPSTATNKAVKWESSHPAIARVSGDIVSAMTVGTATITATTANGFTATCAVDVITEVIEPVTPVIPPTPGVEPAAPKKEDKVDDAADKMTGSDLTSSDLEVVNGAVRIKSEITQKIGNDNKASFDTTYELPVFTASVAISGDVVAVGYQLKGKELLAGTPESVQVLKILSPTSGEMFGYQSVPANFRDKMFTVQNKDDTITAPGTKIDTGREYKLILFIKDGGSFDLDGKIDKRVVDPTSILGTPQSDTPGGGRDPNNPKNSGSGCNAAVPGMAFAFVLALPLLRRRK